jgi:hypothetical protein
MACNKYQKSAINSMVAYESTESQNYLGLYHWFSRIHLVWNQPAGKVKLAELDYDLVVLFLSDSEGSVTSELLCNSLYRLQAVCSTAVARYNQQSEQMIAKRIVDSYLLLSLGDIQVNFPSRLSSPVHVSRWNKHVH